MARKYFAEHRTTDRLKSPTPTSPRKLVSLVFRKKTVPTNVDWNAMKRILSIFSDDPQTVEKNQIPTPEPIHEQHVFHQTNQENLSESKIMPPQEKRSSSSLILPLNNSRAFVRSLKKRKSSPPEPIPSKLVSRIGLFLDRRQLMSLCPVSQRFNSVIDEEFSSTPPILRLSKARYHHPNHWEISCPLDAPTNYNAIPYEAGRKVSMYKFLRFAVSLFYFNRTFPLNWFKSIEHLWEDDADLFVSCIGEDVISEESLKEYARKCAQLRIDHRN